MNLAWADQALEMSLSKIEKNIDRIGEHFPHVAYDGVYNDQGPAFWVSGFWPGLLWLYYEETKDERALDLARALEKRMDEVLDGFVTLHHDVGFMWLPSAVIDYKLTGNETSKVRGLKAASHLAGRFNLAGRFIRAWTDEVDPNSKGWAIIDCMMNIPLLFWASRETKDPRFYHIAEAHADTVLKHFVRSDNTTAHIVSFDPYTGEKIENLGGQGKDADSAWARGQAWLIYGMTLAYRETGKKDYCTAAKNTANYFLAHLPEDQVPYWDFRTDQKDQFVLDSSAAACTASGLLELSSIMEDGPEKIFYYEKALQILKGLYEHHYDLSENSQAMILHGTVNYAKKKHVNVPIIYGDYFFTEALIKLKHETNIF
ncbi:MAG: glycoside hydrolase family 88 protein [Lachnospiraceae bacterium]|nr:glycoside hydrolase family 88 protein [Lachnospiraceae bacterium]